MNPLFPNFCLLCSDIRSFRYNFWHGNHLVNHRHNHREVLDSLLHQQRKKGQVKYY